MKLDANGSILTPSLARYALQQIITSDATSPSVIEMDSHVMKQWEKCGVSNKHLNSPEMLEATMAGIPITVCDSIPKGTIAFVRGDEIIGTIINIGEN